MEANTFLSRVFFLVLGGGWRSSSIFTLEKNGRVLGDGYGETFPNEPKNTNCAVDWPQMQCLFDKAVDTQFWLSGRQLMSSLERLPIHKW